MQYIRGGERREKKIYPKRVTSDGSEKGEISDLAPDDTLKQKKEVCKSFRSSIENDKKGKRIETESTIRRE